MVHICRKKIWFRFVQPCTWYITDIHYIYFRQLRNFYPNTTIHKATKRYFAAYVSDSASRLLHQYDHKVSPFYIFMTLIFIVYSPTTITVHKV